VRQLQWSPALIGWAKNNRQLQPVIMCDMPIPVPSEAIDMLPREMWPIYWEMFPDGRQEMPATVPPQAWRAHMKRTFRDDKPPPPPPILKSYWGKVSSGPVLRDRHAKKRKALGDEPGEARPPPAGPEPPVPQMFWDRYFQLFPHGHCAASRYEPLDGKPAYNESEFANPRYLLRRGTLCIRVSGEHEFPTVYVPSTGCDAFDDCGNWLGPG
jgi:hypothetical protein